GPGGPGMGPGMGPGGPGMGPGATRPSAISQMPTWMQMAGALKRANPELLARRPDIFWTAMDMASQSFLNPQARLAYQLDTIQHREQILAERQREFEIREQRLREQEAGKGKRQDRAITSREGIAERAITSREGIAARAEEGRRQRAEATNAFRDRIATVR